MTRRSIVRALLCCVGLHAGIVAAHAQRLGETPRIVVGASIGRGEPDTLKETISEASLVVYAQVVSSEQVRRGEMRVMPAIEHQVRVIEAIKSTEGIRPGTLLPVTQLGGVVVVDGIEYLADDREFPVFQVGERLLLVLQWNGDWKWVPGWGAPSAYRVRGDSAAIHERARRSSSRRTAFGDRATLPVEELLAIFRAAAREGGTR